MSEDPWQKEGRQEMLTLRTEWGGGLLEDLGWWAGVIRTLSRSGSGQQYELSQPVRVEEGCPAVCPGD